jgi:hypothetical protein
VEKIKYIVCIMYVTLLTYGADLERSNQARVSGGCGKKGVYCNW